MEFVVQFVFLYTEVAGEASVQLLVLLLSLLVYSSGANAMFRLIKQRNGARVRCSLTT